MWIRLQKKLALVKTNNFYIEKARNGSWIIKADVTEGVYTLGEYSTEEKALKVLDMIQNRICGIEYTHLASCNKNRSNFTEIDASGTVFKMPQDSEV